MLVKTGQHNLDGKKIYQSALTGKKGIITDHFRNFLASGRSSARAVRFKAPLIGIVNNNRKRTNGRKIHVYMATKFISFKVEETKIMVKEKPYIIKEHYRDVLRPTSKRIISVPQ